MAVCSRIRQYHPPSRVVEETLEKVAASPPPRRGRPRGSRTTPRPVPVRHAEFLGLRFAEHSDISPAFWNLLCSLVTAVFRGLVKVARKLKVEAPGHEQEHILFVEVPQLLFRLVRDMAAWWWSSERGFLGTTLRCPKCRGDLKYQGDVEKRVVTLFGLIRVSRAYYLCEREGCRHSVCPLDQRLGLDGDSFLPSVQQVVVWLTSLDPYGKCLEFVGKLLHFSICHRSAWLITQKLGSIVKARENEAIARAFSNPADSVFPDSEVPPPAVGVVMFDGTCGRIDYDEVPQTDQSSEEDPDAPTKAPDFREVKLGLVGHLVPPKSSTRKSGGEKTDSLSSIETSAAIRRGKGKKRQCRKVRPLGEEPTLAHKKLAVHLGTPLRLFQMVLLLIHRLALDKARVLLVIGDGAHWIWCGVREHLSSLGVEVVQILDFYHATEHLWGLANAMFGQGTKDAVVWAKAREADLIAGRTAEMFKSLEGALERAKQTSDSVSDQAKQAGEKLALLVQKEITYFRNNQDRINYAEYLRKGYLIGSGAMEGSCRHHVKERIDRGGMHWSASGAMAVLRNRTLIKNNDWNDFWKDDAQRRWKRYQHLNADLTS